MNNNIKVLEHSDELMERYNILATTQNIEDVSAYAVAWQKLAADAREADRPALAAMCQQRGDDYGSLGGTEYVRIIEGSFSEVFEL